MKDPRTVLDNVRMKIPAGAKLLVAYQDKEGGVVMLSQANCTQEDVASFGNAIVSASMQERVGLRG